MDQSFSKSKLVKKPWLVVISFCGLLAILVSIGCSGEKTDRPIIELIPASSTGLVNVNFNEILGDTELVDFVDQLLAQGIDGMQIERSVEGDRMLLIREGGRWHMREPVATRVDQTVLTEWVGQIASSRVGSFISDSPNDLSLFGLQYPSASFKVKDSEGQVWNLLIGSRISAGSQDRFVMIEQQPIVFAMNWNDGSITHRLVFR